MDDIDLPSFKLSRLPVIVSQRSPTLETGARAGAAVSGPEYIKMDRNKSLRRYHKSHTTIKGNKLLTEYVMLVRVPETCCAMEPAVLCSTKMRNALSYTRGLLILH